MPSPIGHALGGFVAGWLVAGAGQEPPARWGRRALAFAGLGLAADLDLVVGRHSQFTHSVGAALIVFGLAALAGRGRRGWLLLAAAAAAAYASHPFLDWLAEDSTAPRGITALWPFSRAYFLSHADIFLGISRQPWRPGMFWHDVVAVSREVLLLAPLAWGAWWLRRSPTAPQILPALRPGADQGLPPPGVAARRGESQRPE